MDQSDARSTGGQEFADSIRQHCFVETDHEMFSTVILTLPLIQEVQLSVLAKKVHKYLLTAQRAKSA